MDAAGLCSTCRYAEILSSASSAFLRCGLSDDHPEYRRFPRLPVLRCDGYALAVASVDDDTGEDALS